MIDTEILRKKVIDLAIQGKLTQQLPEDGSAEDLYAQIQKEKGKLIKEGKIKKEKPLPEISDDEIPFEIPNNWKCVRFSTIISLQSGQDLNSSEYNSDNNGIPYITGASNYGNDGSVIINRWTDFPKAMALHGDILLSCKGTVGKIAILNEPRVHIARQIMGIRTYFMNVMYVRYFIERMVDGIKEASKGLIPGIERNDVLKLCCPIPPLREQERIVNVIETVINELDVIATLQQQYESDCEVLKEKIIDAGIRGELTEQLPEDGSAESLYAKIQEEKSKSINDGKLYKDKLLPAISDTEIPFEIPESWKWVRFGSLVQIERGGSPRPIKSYITDDLNGINWIKIGDVEKDGKYILKTKERIIPEGEKKSRRVYPGDFLLTNSMSFGRPYISKIEGCIHDGWLLIRNKYNVLNLDYLYLLLSSNYAYNQFVQKASGATVDNLNIDKVSTALLPLPPLEEQKRIAETIEQTLELLS